MWISVLEDEAVLNNLITKYLQKEGYSVRSYLRGEDAVQGLDKPTDLWVIDIMLPDIDGFTVFREVQRKNPNSYVIFISARNQDIDRLAGLELGGDDYISKPFLVRELVIKVQRLLKGGAAQNSGGPGGAVHGPSGKAPGLLRRREYQPHGEGVRPAALSGG